MNRAMFLFLCAVFGCDATAPAASPDAGSPDGGGSALCHEAAQCPSPPNAAATCTHDGCGFTCVNGFADCDGDATNGCEVDLTSDGLACGACGHDCRGAACTAGVCAATTVVRAPALSSMIALDQSNLYFAETPGKIARVSKDGGAAVVLDDEQSVPTSIVVDGDTLWWTGSDGTIKRMPSAGGAGAVKVVGGLANPHGLTITGGLLYWIDDRGVLKATMDGSSVGIEANLAASGLVGHGGILCWAQTGTDGNVACSGLGVLAADQPNPQALAIDGTNVYWTDVNGGHSVVMKAAVASHATATALATGYAAHSLASDGKHLYFTVEDQVLMVPLDGGPTTVVAIGLKPDALAVDADWVYWIDSAAILKAPR